MCMVPRLQLSGLQCAVCPCTAVGSGRQQMGEQELRCAVKLLLSLAETEVVSQSDVEWVVAPMMLNKLPFVDFRQ